MGNILLVHWGARPFAIVRLALTKGFPDGVVARDKITVGTKLLKNFFTYTGHDHHVTDNIGAIGKFDTNLGNI